MKRWGWAAIALGVVLAVVGAAELAVWPILIGIGIFVAGWISRSVGTHPTKTKPSARRAITKDEDEVSYDEVEVVGESQYQDALWKIVGGKPRGEDRPTWRGQATLLPEPSNRHDRNAVCVKIGGKTVGYLDRDTAADLQPALIRLRKRTGKDFAAPCYVKGGFRRDDGSRASLGVVLEFDTDAVLDAAEGK